MSDSLLKRAHEYGDRDVQLAGTPPLLILELIAEIERLRALTDDLADVLTNHTDHEALMKTTIEVLLDRLEEGATPLVVYTGHRDYMDRHPEQRINHNERTRRYRGPRQ